PRATSPPAPAPPADGPPRRGTRFSAPGRRAGPTGTPRPPRPPCRPAAGAGPHDAATPPPRSERIAELIPAARLHTLADCGHTSSLEQPAAVTALLQEFLATIDGPWTD
ncbi:alpha/beta fold hydrolase, partial [Nocardia abscessus]|uniref:alpha/beta fold hydrolase n=1 Tax=Nocardia abscessus TaxID=120957 RepID=UPI003CC80AEE